MAAGQIRPVSISQVDFLENVASVVTAVRIKKAASVEFESDIETVTYAGDGSEEKKFILKEISATIQSPDIDQAGLLNILGTSLVTTALPVGVAERQYLGTETEGAGTICGCRATVLAEDVLTGVTGKFRLEMPYGTLSAVTPPALKNIGPENLSLKFAAVRTTKDVAGAALPSVPTNGAIWFIDRLT